MPRLDEFRTMIDETSDEKLLDASYQLVSEMMEINKIKLRLQELEAGLTDGGKACFYFFASDLDEDELVYAAERISGKLKRIQRKKEQEERIKQQEEKVSEKEQENANKVSNK